MTTDDLDRMLQGRAKSAKLEKAGDTITGIVTEVAVRQATEYGTGKPLTFDNGDPREQIVVIIRAEGIERVDEDDDLHRAVYIKGWGTQRRAFIEAVKKAKKPEPGDRFTATLTGLEASKSGGFPAKLYEYRIEGLQAEADAQWASAPEASDARAQARKLLEMSGGPGGLSHAQIAAATGLPVDEVAGMDVPF